MSIKVTPVKMVPEEEFNPGHLPRCLVRLSVPFSLAWPLEISQFTPKSFLLIVSCTRHNFYCFTFTQKCLHSHKMFTKHVVRHIFDMA